MLHYGTGKQGRKPLVFIPSLINPPHVLDLSESQSLLRHFAARGHDSWLVDWGAPLPEDSDLDLAGHVEHRLLPLLRTLPEPPVLVGYCLGGTLAIAAASRIPVAGLVAIAAPWDFGAFPDDTREQIASLWANAKPVCERLGYVPMEVLQAGFWAIDPARTVRKYAAFAEMEAGSDAEKAFLVLEDWANAGPPLTLAAGMDLFDGFYAGNAAARGEWRVGGDPVSIDRLDCPSLSIASQTDRIVPAASAPRLREIRTLGLGHVGMIVGRSAPETLWVPLEQWVTEQGG